MFKRIVTAHAASCANIRIVYDDGVEGEVDLTPLIEKGGVFSRLADPSVFAQVQVGEQGRFIEWPENVDLCADASRELIMESANRH